MWGKIEGREEKGEVAHRIVMGNGEYVQNTYRANRIVEVEARILTVEPQFRFHQTSIVLIVGSITMILKQVTL